MELTKIKQSYNQEMKILMTFLLFSASVFAGYGKPVLVARYSGIDSFNAPDGLGCFHSEPLPTKDGVYLGCQNAQGKFLMVRFNPSFELLSTSRDDLFSTPKELDGKVSWYEFNQGGVSHLYESFSGALKVFDLKNLGPMSSLIDSFIPVKNNSYVYRMQEATKKLLIWKDQSVSTLYQEDISHIFPPVSSVAGDFIIKVRREDLSESAPDELILWNGEFKSMLKDRDADPLSSIKSFRHLYSLDQDVVALVATDDHGEAMFLLKNGKMQEVARAGKDLKRFDFFSPKLRQGVLVFRGEDLENRKAVWIYESGVLKRLLTQGDVVKTDKGLARVDYQSQDAIFYGAPGIGENGDIYLQATLTDIDSPATLLGVGLIKLKKE